jgi:hypothetical protein
MVDLGRGIFYIAVPMKPMRPMRPLLDRKWLKMVPHLRTQTEKEI